MDIRGLGEPIGIVLPIGPPASDSEWSCWVNGLEIAGGPNGLPQFRPTRSPFNGMAEPGVSDWYAVSSAPPRRRANDCGDRRGGCTLENAVSFGFLEHTAAGPRGAKAR